jgi:Predicted oxidoreductases (related to aryl-alcohol dehydrogenases)
LFFCIGQIIGYRVSNKYGFVKVWLRAWLLKGKGVPSVLIGASSAVQLKQSLVCLNNTHFDKIGVEQILKED